MEAAATALEAVPAIPTAVQYSALAVLAFGLLLAFLSMRARDRAQQEFLAQVVGVLEKLTTSLPATVATVAAATDAHELASARRAGEHEAADLRRHAEVKDALRDSAERTTDASEWLKPVQIFMRPEQVNAKEGGKDDKKDKPAKTGQ